MKHISLSGGYNPPTEIKASGRLQECAEEDFSNADAHSAARTLERSCNYTIKKQIRITQDLKKDFLRKYIVY